jgi:quinol monooxygenase YgiN
MIVVIGRVKTDAERRDRLIVVGQRVAQASREEPGCASYRLYEDSERPNEFVFIEVWESEEALQRHFATEHIAQFMLAAPETLVEAPDVQFHTVAGSRDLTDVSGR